MVPTEYEEQCVFVDWLELHGLKFTAIPNSTWTTSQAQKMKNYRSGLRKGFPDMVVLTPAGLVAVELKRVKGGKVAAEQQEWIDALNEAGVPTKVCRGAVEAIEFVKQYTNIKEGAIY